MGDSTASMKLIFLDPERRLLDLRTYQSMTFLFDFFLFDVETHAMIRISPRASHPIRSITGEARDEPAIPDSELIHRERDIALCVHISRSLAVRG